MDTLADLKSKLEEAVAEMEQLQVTAAAEDRELTTEENMQFDALNEKCDLLNRKIQTTTALLKQKAKLEEAKVPVSAGTKTQLAQPATAVAKSPIADMIRVPASVKRWGNLKSFRGPAADVKAYKAGMFYMACAGNPRAQAWLEERTGEIYAAAQVENVNTKGGYLVYDELDNTIIDLRDQYGVFTRNARRVAMTSDVMNRPRRTGGLTAYFIDEDSAITESNKSWDKVGLTAKKLGAVARISNELSEDAIINVADDLTQEIAWAFAKKLDQCGFIGDGTSTYGGIFGVSPRLAAMNGTDDGGGLVKSADNVFADMVIGDLTKCISILPAYAHARAKWYCSAAVWGQVMLRLNAAASGNTIATLEAGGSTRQMLGYPVELTEVLPTSDSNSQICLLFGDLALAADFGDRRQTTVKFSDSAVIGSASVFERDETAIIGTMRGDINCHDIGTATAAGPVIGLISHSA